MEYPQEFKQYFQSLPEKENMEAEYLVWECNRDPENVKITFKKLMKKYFPYLCRSGNLELVKWIYNEYPCDLHGKINIHQGKEKAFRWSCEAGHLEIAKWLYEIGKGKRPLMYRTPCDKAFELAVSNGHIDVVKFLYGLYEEQYRQGAERHLELSHMPDLNIAFGGTRSMELAMWIYDKAVERNIKLDYSSSFTNFSGSGNLAALKWLYTLRSSPNIINTGGGTIEFSFATACSLGQFDVAVWLYELDEKVLEPNLFEYACSGNSPGHLALAEWIWGKMPSVDMAKAFKRACMKGLIDMAKWLYAKLNPTSPCIDEAFLYACGQGQMEVVEWLYKPSLSVSKAFIKSFNSQCLELIQWLYARLENVPIGHNMHYNFISMCQRRKLDIVKWLCSVFPGYAYRICGEKIIPLIRCQIERCAECENIKKNDECNHTFCEECGISNYEVCPLCLKDALEIKYNSIDNYTDYEEFSDDIC